MKIIKLCEGKTYKNASCNMGRGCWFVLTHDVIKQFLWCLIQISPWELGNTNGINTGGIRNETTRVPFSLFSKERCLKSLEV